MNEDNFVRIVSYNGRRGIGSDLGVNIEEKDNELQTWGHSGKGNEEWKRMDENEEVLMIFEGCDGYIC